MVRLEEKHDETSLGAISENRLNFGGTRIPVWELAFFVQLNVCPTLETEQRKHSSTALAGDCR